MDNGGGSNTGAAHIFQINPELFGTRIAELERITAIETNGLVSNSAGITSIIQGDLIYASADSTLSRLPMGAANRVLKSDGTNVVWGIDDGGSGSGTSPADVTRIANLEYSNNAIWSNLASNVDRIEALETSNVDIWSNLASNVVRIVALETNGILSNSSGITSISQGDLIYASADSTLQTLTVSATAGHVLKVAGGVPVWAAESGGPGGQWAIVNTNDIHYSSGNVGIGTNNPGAELDISGTGAVIVPNGTTAERPATVVNGMIRYNSTTGFMEAYTPQGWGGLSGDQPQSVSGISPVSVLLANTGTQVFTVTGGGFTTGSTVQLVGANGGFAAAEYTVFDTTVVSASQITFKMGVDGATGGYDKTQRPYRVKVTGQDFNVTQSSATIGFGGLSWTLPAANATLNYTSGTTTTENLVATDDLGGSDVTFSIVSGTLNGLTLASATASPATFGGSATGAATNSILFRITDNVSGATADRTFSINAVVSLLYSFSTHTFTKAGGDTRYGPQLADTITAYGNITPWNDTALFNVTTRGFQLWTVPKTGTYRIIAKGAKGGNKSTSASPNYGNTPGYGGHVYADFALTMNTKIVIIVGQQPPTSTGNYRSGSGGGATWVLKPGAYTNTDDVYLVAGGGGGAGPGHYISQQAGSADASSQGTLGGGGTSHWNNNGGGAGWTADGAPSGARGGVMPAGGAMGGTGTTHGGFGGGGSESGDSAAGGAGATGGRAAIAFNSTGTDTARGGTSYIQPDTLERISGTQMYAGSSYDNDGSVIVQYIP